MRRRISTWTSGVGMRWDPRLGWLKFDKGLDATGTVTVMSGRRRVAQPAVGRTALLSRQLASQYGCTPPRRWRSLATAAPVPYRRGLRAGVIGGPTVVECNRSRT
jgi:hypothetical protein